MSNAVYIDGECLTVLRQMEDESVDAIVTDPPYGLSNATTDKLVDAVGEWAGGNRAYVPTKTKGFMGLDWDSFVPPPAVWDECLRVLKPGGHMLVFAGARTQDLMGLSIRFAGFEIRDTLGWIYGSGFPKSMNVAKAVESKLKTGKSNSRSLRETEQSGDGESYQLTGKNNGILGETRVYDRKEFSPETEEAQSWEGWGTALKPAIEPIILARKPIVGTVAGNVLEHGTGALNIDACRVSTNQPLVRPSISRDDNDVFGKGLGARVQEEPDGRFPANVVLDEHAAAELDGQSEEASRFFPVFKYQAKASKKERPVIECEDGTKIQHPTVKPVGLMEWCVKLITPPGGVVLDPFAGTGSTLEAAENEGFDSIGIERDPAYCLLIEERLNGRVS